MAFAAGDGTVSFASQILIGNGGPLTTYVSNAGPFVGFGIYPIINNAGVVAFIGGLDGTGQSGIFTGPDPAADKVILTGEPLFGSVLSSVVPTNIEHAGIIDMNDSGQIAFHYRLADGREGIAVGTPVPEPFSLAIGLAGIIGLLCQRLDTSRQRP